MTHVGDIHFESALYLLRWLSNGVYGGVTINPYLVLSKDGIDSEVIIVHDHMSPSYVFELRRSTRRSQLVMTYTKRIPLAARRAACLTPVVPLPHWRAFLFTSCARAAEPDDTIYHNFKNTSIFHKISEKPEALAALRDFGTLLDEKGCAISLCIECLTSASLAKQESTPH